MFGEATGNVCYRQLKKHKKRINIMKVKSLISLLLCCLPTILHAHNLKNGEALPPVSVEKHGEILIEKDDIIYKPWSNNQLVGKVRVIQAIAGRSSAKEMNAELMKAITDAQFSKDEYQTTSIINQDDAIWGTGSFVKSSAQDSKKEFPWSSMVLDEDGTVAKKWKLAEESSTIILLDKQGIIQFVKDGSLSNNEINQVISLIKSNL